MKKPLLPIRIRRLQLSDLDAIMEIEAAAYGAHHWSRKSFLSELTSAVGSYFGAECPETGQLLGYTGYWLVADEAHITTLAVHPGFRRRRIAERLLLNSILEARKGGAIWLKLEVRESNESAQKLYFKYGFRKLGKRRHYYQDNREDALVLFTERLSEPEYIDLVLSQVTRLGLAVQEANDVLVGAAESPSLATA